VGADVRNLSPGQRVVLVPGASCGSLGKSAMCAMCVRGLPLLCLQRDDCALPLGAGAGWSEACVRHASRVIAIPDGLSDEAAVLVEPLACSAHAVLRRPPAPGDSVVVLGCGVIGLGCILALRALRIPLRIIALARHPAQAERAREAGADAVLSSAGADLYEQLAAELRTEVLARGRGNRLLRWGASVIYDAVGSGQTLGHALRWARPRGAVVVEGITPRPAPCDCTVVWLREVDLLGAHGHGLEDFEGHRRHTFDLVLAWLREGRMSPGAWITHRYPLRDYRRALAAADGKARSAAGKVLLELG
jgi:threonine dehydrogenase-like Zn-dependent dehydrogenase